MNDETEQSIENDLNDRDQTGNQMPAPIFNLPASIVWFVVLLLAIHGARTYLISASLDETILVQGGFIPARFEDFMHLSDLVWLWTLVTYSLLHGSAQHVFFNCIWMVVFGGPVATRLGTVRSLVFFVLSSAFAALGFMVVHPGSVILLIGASGIVSGLTGAACRFALGNGLSPQSRATAAQQRQMSIVEALTNRSVLSFIVFWFAANVLLGAGAGILEPGSTAVAWEAHIAGFLFGFLFFPLFDPTPKGVAEEQA